MKKINVAVLGDAGVLGQRFIERLVNHPTFEIATLADLMVAKGTRTLPNGVSELVCRRM